MDSLLTQLPGKANDPKPKLKQKGNQAAKAKLGTGEQLKKNGVFGTVRSTNIEGKPVWDTTIAKTKTKTVIPHRQPKPKPKPIRATQLPIDHTTQADKKSPENVKPSRLNKKISDTLIPQLQAEKNTTKNNSQENNDSAAEPKTPVTTTPPPKHVRGNKSKVAATPFYSAVNCSKCRFDKLETSSYWIAQIKLAESVGKHFVAVACFKLAFECQAEPIRNLRIQLRRYLSRHGYLLEQKEWREVASTYGLENLLPGTG